MSSPGAYAPFACLRGDPDRGYAACAQVTPRIERYLDALMLDLQGSERLLLPAGVDATDPDWERLAEALARRVPHGPAIGVAPSRTLAWLAARTPWAVVTPDQARVFLDSLPVARLREAPDLAGMEGVAETLTSLEQSGVRTVGRLMRLTPYALHRRFGSCGPALAIVAAGNDLRPLRAERAERWFSARLPLDPPMRVEQLSQAFAPLAGRMAERLRAQGLVAGIVAIFLAPDSGEVARARRVLTNPVATADALLDHALRLTEQIVARVAARTYGEARLRVGGLRPASPEQRSLWSSGAGGDKNTHKDHLIAIARAAAQSPGLAPLLRVASTSADEVLPEERYRFEPLSL